MGYSYHECADLLLYLVIHDILYQSVNRKCVKSNLLPTFAYTRAADHSLNHCLFAYSPYPPYCLLDETRELRVTFSSANYVLQSFTPRIFYPFNVPIYLYSRLCSSNYVEWANTYLVHSRIGT